MTEHERIADLENQIMIWRGLHKADQELIVALVKQNVELKRINEKCAEMQAIFEAFEC